MSRVVEETNLPHPFVAVVWQDAYASLQPMSVQEAKSLKPEENETRGWLLHFSKEQVVLASEFCGDYLATRMVSVIPTSLVVSIRRARGWVPFEPVEDE